MRVKYAIQRNLFKKFSTGHAHNINNKIKFQLKSIFIVIDRSWSKSYYASNFQLWFFNCTLKSIVHTYIYTLQISKFFLKIRRYSIIIHDFNGSSGPIFVTKSLQRKIFPIRITNLYSLAIARQRHDASRRCKHGTEKRGPCHERGRNPDINLVEHRRNEFVKSTDTRPRGWYESRASDEVEGVDALGTTP